MTKKQRDILKNSHPTDLPKNLTDGLPQKIHDFSGINTPQHLSAK